MTRELLLAAWPQVVRRWLDAGPGTPAAGSVLADVLRDGLITDASSGSPAEPIPAQDALRCEIELVRLSGAVDERGYEQHKRAALRTDPVTHFCTTGWRDFANPSRDFDLWWYWFDVLGLDHDDVNPLLHFLLVGRRAGLGGTPPTPALGSSTTFAGSTVRRAFLFAGYDVDRMVDPYVVRYVRELSRHGDVHYLADTPLPASELDRLRPFTAGCWAIAHGRYDFGSYAMLARDLVGWERLEEYDEIVLVNDSCYLLTDLDRVFGEMDARTCDWWGLQASKRGFEAGHGDTEPIPLAEAKARMIGPSEWHQRSYLHVSSYFVALRRPAFLDPGLRRLLDQVVTQEKKDVILKYELGLSRQLLAAGHDVDTFIGDLYPFHPVYSKDYVELVRRGFPVLKRTLLAENPMHVPDLARWKERVLEQVPGAPVEEIERNLLRVSPDDGLQAAFAVVTRPDGTSSWQRPMGPAAMRNEDRRTPKHRHWWAFPVDSRTHQLSTDARVLLEEVADDPSIRKIVLSRSQRIELEGVNLEVHPLDSAAGLARLYRSGTVVVSGDPGTEVPDALSAEGHRFVDLGHPDTPGDLGRPRHDLLGNDVELPPDLAAQREALRSLLSGRRLLLWLVGARPLDTAPPPPPGAEDLARLAAWAHRHDVLVAVRDETGDRTRRHAAAFDAVGALELTVRGFPHVEASFGLVDVLVTDQADRAADFRLTGKPVLPAGHAVDDLDTALASVRPVPDPVHTHGRNAWRLAEHLRRLHLSGGQSEG